MPFWGSNEIMLVWCLPQSLAILLFLSMVVLLLCMHLSQLNKKKKILQTLKKLYPLEAGTDVKEVKWLPQGIEL